MSVNTSGSSPSTVDYHCVDSRVAVELSTILNSGRVMVLLPACVLVVYLGLQRRRRSSQSLSHGDVFTFHLVAFELIGLVGCLVSICGFHTAEPRATEVGLHLTDPVFPAEMSFHVLTCAERYLAVVHPVVYRRMKQSAGVRVRNASVACVWLLCCSWIGMTIQLSPDLPIIPTMALLVLSLVNVSFCSLRVLCILMRPRPGDVRAANRAMRRTVATIAVILLAQWLWFCALLVTMALDTSKTLGHGGGCVALVAGMGFSLPSTLVLPLQFLYRARKRLRCVCFSGG